VLCAGSLMQYGQFRRRETDVAALRTKVEAANEKVKAPMTHPTELPK
jgi:hypothetical protein